MDGYANCFYRNDDGRFVEVAPELGLDTGGGDSGGTRFARLLLLFLASSFNDLYLKSHAPECPKPAKQPQFLLRSTVGVWLSPGWPSLDVTPLSSPEDFFRFSASSQDRTLLSVFAAGRIP